MKTFAYNPTAGHVAFFGFMSELKDPRDYPKSLCLLQGIDTVLYIVTAVVIYVFAGPNVTSPALGSAGPMIAKIAYGIALPTVSRNRSSKTLELKLTYSRSSSVESSTATSPANSCTCGFSATATACTVAISWPPAPGWSLCWFCGSWHGLSPRPFLSSTIS